MVRDILIVTAFFLGGMGAGFALSEAMQPTRYDVANDLAEKINEQGSPIRAQLETESQTGPVVYAFISKGSKVDEGLSLARIEIGYEGQYLPSLWNNKTKFFDYHWNKEMEEDELLDKIRSLAEERVRE